MTRRADLFFYSSGGEPPPPEGPDRSYALAGALVEAQVGGPLVAREGYTPPRLRASLHRRPNIGPEVATLTGATNRQWEDELNEVGSAQMTIPNEDPQSTLVGPGDVVRFEDDGFAVFAWIVREINRTQIARGEEHDQVTTFSGVGLLGILQEAVVYPSNGLEMQPIEDKRRWTFASNDYDDTWWNPAMIYPVTDGYQPGANETPVGYPPNSGMYAGITDWPLRGCPRITAPGTTYWVAPGGWSYMRRLLYFAPDDPTRQLIVYWAADDVAQVYFDGQQVGEATVWENSNADLQRFEVEITPGWHVIAAAVQNSEDGAMWSELFNEFINPWSFMCAGYAMDPITGDVEGGPIFVSDTTWKMVAYPPHPPGWTPGAVIRRCLLEAQYSRGGLVGVTTSFTDEVDSQGTAWPETGAIATDVGTDYFTFFRELCETYVDLWMDAGTFTLNAVVKDTRGTTAGAALLPVSDPTDPWSGNLAGLTFKKVD